MAKELWVRDVPCGCGCGVTIPNLVDVEYDDRGVTERVGKGQPGISTLSLDPDAVVVETLSRSESHALIAGLLAGA